jgi:hypothetical protein
MRGRSVEERAIGCPWARPIIGRCRPQDIMPFVNRYNPPILDSQ